MHTSGGQLSLRLYRREELQHSGQIKDCKLKMETMNRKLISDYFGRIRSRAAQQKFGAIYIDQLPTDEELLTCRGWGRASLHKLSQIREAIVTQPRDAYSLRRRWPHPLGDFDRGTAKTASAWASILGISEEDFIYAYEIGTFAKWFRR